MKTFSALTAAPTGPPIEFTVEGLMRVQPVPEAIVDAVGEPTGEMTAPEPAVWSETFRALSNPPAKVLDDFWASIDYNERGDRRYNRVRTLAFVRGVLVPEDEARWDALVNDKDRNVELALVAQIAGWLVTEMSGRPSGT